MNRVAVSLLLGLFITGLCSANPSRLFGYDATLRPHRDSSNDVIVLTDPGQTALTDDVITSWRLFVKILSVQHDVYLQVWRPLSTDGSESHVKGSNSNQPVWYRLVGQTLFQPEKLRSHELHLRPDEFISIKRGDVLGLYYPRHNPLPWTSVPCSSTGRIHMIATRDPSTVDEGKVKAGTKMRFVRAAEFWEEGACRQYSLAAVLGGANYSVYRTESRPCRNELDTCPILLGEHFQLSNGEAIAQSVRDAGAGGICEEVFAIEECVTRALQTPDCPKLPDYYKKSWLARLDLYDFLCRRRIDDFDEHLNCLVDAKRIPTMENCFGYHQAIVDCESNDTRPVTDCVMTTYGSSPSCSTAAVDFVNEFFIKMADTWTICDGRQGNSFEFLTSK